MRIKYMALSAVFLAVLLLGTACEKEISNEGKIQVEITPIADIFEADAATEDNTSDIVSAIDSNIVADIMSGKEKNMDGYISITMNEAKKIFDTEGEKNYIILDVRRSDEFSEGHIAGAINIANESIETTRPKELTELEQVIYVYCRSGRRSKQAAAKLAAMGYTNIIEFGGILDWPGPVVTD